MTPLPENVNKNGRMADKGIRMKAILRTLNACVISTALFFAQQAAASNAPEACRARDEVQKEYDRLAAEYEAARAEAKKYPENTTDYDGQAAWRKAKKLETNLEIKQQSLSNKKIRCEDVVREMARCTEKKNNKENGVDWEWNAATGSCENLAHKTRSVGDGDCSKADLYSGSSLKGQNCKIARNTVEEVNERNKALTEITVTGATSIAQVQAMAASGQQQDAQKRANKMLMGLSLAKIATGLSQGAGAVQLKNAASDAEEASTRMNNAYKQIDSVCANPAGNVSREECFYSNAGKYGISPDKQAYAQYLSGGASQAEEAAKAANQAATGSTITGLADTLVGLQALQMARQANRNADNMGALPPPRVIGIAPIQGASQAPNLGGFNQGTSPVDYGNPSDSGAALGNVGEGNIRGGLKEGRSFGGGSGFVSAKSTVSSGGGAGGGGGGRGGGGQSRAPGRKSLGNTAVGEYAMGGGGGAGFKGGSGKDEKDSGGNAFADALAKLFPQDEDGKPIVDGRQLASEREGVYTDEEGSIVYASDLSIFEQVTAKYRQLSSAGSI